MTTSPLHAPFPYFGGKRLDAPIIWPRFGQVQNYVESFAGSLVSPPIAKHPDAAPCTSP